MMTFFWPWVFLLLPLPLLFRRWIKPATATPVGSTHLALKIPVFNDVFNNVPKNVLINQVALFTTEQPETLWHKRLITPALIWLLLVTSAAQPLWLDDNQPTPVSGRDLILVIDISGSMRQMDFERLDTSQSGTTARISTQSQLTSQKVEQLKLLNVSRLEVVKEVAAKFVAERHGDRIGLILFGDKPYLRASPSYDRQAVISLIKESEIALAGESTAIGDAIGLAIKRLQDLQSQSRVIILLTDGANNEGMVSPRRAAQLAAMQGIRIYTIGIGKQEIPGPNPYGVWSSQNARQFEKEVLRDIAQLADGQFFHALDTVGLQSAYQQLDQLEPSLSDDARLYFAQPLYPWTLAAALLLSVLGFIRGWLPVPGN
jgi:Ca-activated chloride channel family protein